MSLQLFGWDEWSGTVSSEPEVLEPNWKDIETAIRRLDAKIYTMVWLVADDADTLLIGGGPNQFVMIAFLDEDSHVTAQDESKSPGQVELTIGGQTGIHDNRIVWNLETVLKCAHLFWKDNILNDSIAWV